MLSLEMSRGRGGPDHPARCGAETLPRGHLGHRTARDGVSLGPLTSTAPATYPSQEGQMPTDAPGVPCPKSPLAFLPDLQSPGAAPSAPRLGQPLHDQRKPGEVGLSLPSAGWFFLPAPSSPTQSADTHLQSLKEHSAPTERPRMPRIALRFLFLGSCQGFTYSQLCGLRVLGLCQPPFQSHFPMPKPSRSLPKHLLATTTLR